jgi:L-2-hydroxyglutarate oxidase LhgO
MPVEVDIAVIGAGVVGLAIAAELAQKEKGIFVFEKNHTFGLETSSRNSEVIHAGIYYAEDTLKTRLCIEGNRQLYELCEKHGIAYKKTGKIVVAVDEDEVRVLEGLYEQGQRNGVEGLRLISRRELKRLEPHVEAIAALVAPTSGILDSHALMRLYYAQARERGAGFVFNTEVTGIEKVETGYAVKIRDREGDSSFITRILINSAGLNSDKIAAYAGIDLAQANYRLHYCKGEYFSLSLKEGAPVGRLVYPVPEQAGKGIHVTVALDGRVRLGPNTRYVDEVDYTVDEAQRPAFYQSVSRFLPLIELEDLEPEFAGIRPKLQAPGEDFRDFVIAHEEGRGLPGLINLIGIESPGLTAAPAIARYVAAMVKELH